MSALTTAPIGAGHHVWVGDVTQIHPCMTGAQRDGWYVHSISGVVAIIRRPSLPDVDWWTPLSNLRRVAVTR